MGHALSACAGMGLFSRSRTRRAGAAGGAAGHMSADYVIKLPDVGEGVTEAELVEWHVKVGDKVRSDKMLGAVMTDKATVEIPSPVDGEVTWLAGQPGEKIAVGAPLARIATDANAAEAPAVAAPVTQTPSATPAVRTPVSGKALAQAEERPLASPAVRMQARNAHVDLHDVRGTGPDGHILHEDVDRYLAARA